MASQPSTVGLRPVDYPERKHTLQVLVHGLAFTKEYRAGCTVRSHRHQQVVGEAEGDLPENYYPKEKSLGENTVPDAGDAIMIHENGHLGIAAAHDFMAKSGL